MLLDEPTSALDQQAKTGIEELVRNLVDEDRFTMVLVTHDRDQARRICDRVGLIEAGRLVQLGTPAEVLHA
jgi:ABC-type sulfate/molybdate transport systems ATPase subunit